MKVIVLCYHRVLPNAHISPGIFTWQLAWLKRTFKCVALQEICDYTAGRHDLGGRDSFAVTFDDGWLDNYVYVFPILKELGLKATLFLSTSLVRPEKGGGLADHPPDFRNFLSRAAREVIQQGSSQEFLSWPEIREMQVGGVYDIQSHGHSHWRHVCGPASLRLHTGDPVSGFDHWFPDVWDGSLHPGSPVFEHCGCLAQRRYVPDPRLIEAVQGRWLEKQGVGRNGRVLAAALAQYPGHWEGDQEFLERVTRDLLTSRRLIEQHIGSAPTYLAWPFGEYSALSLEAVRQAGFQACFTTHLGAVRPGMDPWALPRLSPPSSKHWFKRAVSSNLGLSVYKIGVRCLAWKRAGWRQILQKAPASPKDQEKHENPSCYAGL